MDTCPDADGEPHPCQENPTIAPWAEKKCNIINSGVFKDCHAKVPPAKYYENCLYDTCGCNAGGDCQCFCTSVAAYAQVHAWNLIHVLSSWRSHFDLKVLHRRALPIKSCKQIANSLFADDYFCFSFFVFLSCQPMRGLVINLGKFETNFVFDRLALLLKCALTGVTTTSAL